jgi:hypothetical protein
MTHTTDAVTVLSESDAVRQSLAMGSAATALLRLEQAVNGSAPWQAARAHIRDMTTGPVDAGDHSGLYYGAPAVAFVLHCAAEADTRYTPAAAHLDHHLRRLIRRKLTTATSRLQHNRPASFGEYDVFHGLTGIAALLLRRMPDSNLLGDVLDHLVQLTQPRMHDGIRLPGWWVNHDPDQILPTPGGHANLGMAHGAAGILATLALAMRAGRTVEHHSEAITRLTGWFDRWRQHHTDHGTWWPQWLTRHELATGRVNQTQPGRPSWCYGTPGIARALHQAAIATSDPRRRDDAEHVLANCLTDPHLRLLTDPGLCHGLAGLYQTAFRAAADAHTPAIASHLPSLTALHHADVPTDAGDSRRDREGGLLTGPAGVKLAAQTARHGAPVTGWDTCLLIT